jgi:hypothetical protein
VDVSFVRCLCVSSQEVNVVDFGFRSVGVAFGLWKWTVDEARKNLAFVL